MCMVFERSADFANDEKFANIFFRFISNLGILPMNLMKMLKNTLKES